MVIPLSQLLYLGIYVNMLGENNYPTKKKWEYLCQLSKYIIMYNIKYNNHVLQGGAPVR